MASLSICYLVLVALAGSLVKYLFFCVCEYKDINTRRNVSLYCPIGGDVYKKFSYSGATWLLTSILPLGLYMDLVPKKNL